MTVEVSMDRRGKQVNTAIAKQETLTWESVPLSHHDQYHEQHPVGSVHTHVTEPAV